VETRYKIKTAPTWDPITVDELKRNLHIEINNHDQDEYLQEILLSIIDQVQTDIGRQIARATYTMYLDGYPDGDEVEITLGPVDAISTVKYYADGASELTTVDAGDYQLDNTELTGRLRFFNSFITDDEKMNVVQIEFTNGYGSAPSVPRSLKDAIILLASDRYLNPENSGVSVNQSAAERLLRNYRIQRY